MTEQYQHLTATERHRLIQLLKTFKNLFDGTLGTWKTTPIESELKDDTKPVWSRPYAVPEVHKAMSQKEFRILISLGIPEEANEFE